MFFTELPVELCSTWRSGLTNLVENALSGHAHLVDVGGRYYDVRNWKRIKPFGGVRALPRLLLFVWAAPELSEGEQLSVDAYKAKVLEALKKYHHQEELGDAYARLRNAATYEACMAVVPRL